MQQIKFGDMLQLKSGIIVHGCNAQGVMGGGIAWQIRNQYPQAYEEYVGVHKAEGGLRLGDVIFTTIDQAAGLFIANAITQKYYGTSGKKYVSYKAVFEAMKTVAEFSEDIGIPVHYPLIGAGLAGGDWSIIQPVIDAAFKQDAERTLWILPDDK